jgi:hypothetical protein
MIYLFSILFVPIREYSCSFVAGTLFTIKYYGLSVSPSIHLK